MQVLTQTLPLELNPLNLMEIFKDEPNLFFLDSSLDDPYRGRFSYIGFSPFKTIRLKNFNELRKALKPYMGLVKDKVLSSGAVGSISYDGSMVFGLYDGIICFDRDHQTLTIAASGVQHKDPSNQTKEAQQKIDYVLFKIHNHVNRSIPHKKLSDRLVMKSCTTKSEYIKSVKKALKCIYDGDIYQINLSQCFEAKVKNWRQCIEPLSIYKHLRELSPSAFSAYLDQGDQVILSSSPERFLKLTDGIVEVCPMKGTRPRGKTLAIDKENRQELLESAKEKAELLMVTDLERNDLGRVCDFGSVRVKEMRSIEEYSTVFQATSTIEGRLRKDCDAFDLLESTFPSGSVTGCPKIAARKIINQLEKTKRGFYTGALGYINFSGDMDFNVLIRTLFLQKERISFYVGGGIVADSDPLKEYEETLIKASAMKEALIQAFKI